MLFRQLFDQDSSTYSYLLADAVTREAVLIDPVFEQYERDRTLIEELQLKLRYVLDTHVHADHVTSGGLLRDHFGAKTILSERAGVVCADLQVKQGDQIRFGSHVLEVRETPGHTAVRQGCTATRSRGLLTRRITARRHDQLERAAPADRARIHPESPGLKCFGRYCTACCSGRAV